MKFKNKLYLKLRLHSIDGTEEGGGGGESSGKNESQNTSANNESQNNNSDNVEDFSNLWHTEEKKPDTDTVQNVNVINQPVAEQTPQERLDAHMSTLDLTGGFDLQQMQDPETAQKVMEQMARQIYTAAMKDANVITNQQITRLREELQTETQQSMQGDRIIRDMNKAIPFTSKAQYKPIADSLITRFLEKGDSTEKAIENVSLYFQGLQKEVSGFIPQAANDRMGNRGFGNGSTQQPNQNSEEEQDWVKFFNAN